MGSWKQPNCWALASARSGAGVSFRWGYTWTKTFLHSKGLLEAARRGAHRRKRPHRPLPGGAGQEPRQATLRGAPRAGMMLPQAGPPHEWLAGQPALDLIVTLDDATSVIYSAFLVAQEGTASTFRALTEVFRPHGLPLSLYTDRGRHSLHTAEAGRTVDRTQPTQVGRALAPFASSISRPIRRRHAAARNACSIRCRTG